MTSLASNMLRHQMDPIFQMYGDNITFDEHLATKPFDKDITVDVVKLQNGKVAYVFNVNPLGSCVTFKAVWCCGEYLGCDIDAKGLIGSMGEYSEMVSALTCEIHRIMEAYAKANNFPSVNLLQYSNLNLGE